MESQFKQRLGSMLFHAGKIDKDQLEKSLQMQKEDQGYLGQIFLSNGYISEEDLYLNLSRQLKIPFLRLGTFSNDKNLLKLFLDAGNVWGVDYSDDIDDSNKIRSSTGVALEILTPVGPLSFS